MGTIQYKNNEGKRISGVTTIISQNLGWNKQQLMWWANQMGLDGKNHREVAQKAADAGTLAHGMIEADIKGASFVPAIEDQTIKNKAETCFLNFLDWKKQVHFKPIQTETHLVSEKYQYGATPDCIAEINGKLSLFDWKTSNGVYPDMLIQLAAYRQVWNELYYRDNDITGGFYLLRIVKEDASWHYHHWEDLSEAWEVFKHLLVIHKMQKVLKKKL